MVRAQNQPEVNIFVKEYMTEFENILVSVFSSVITVMFIQIRSDQFRFCDPPAKNIDNGRESVEDQIINSNYLPPTTY